MTSSEISGTSMASVWYGWDNGIPQPYTAPDYLAPRQQEFLAWPKWGQYYQTKGSAGEADDLPAAKRLLELFAIGTIFFDDDERTIDVRQEAQAVVR